VGDDGPRYLIRLGDLRDDGGEGLAVKGGIVQVECDVVVEPVMNSALGVEEELQVGPVAIPGHYLCGKLILSFAEELPDHLCLLVST
jgi:hypothetical protein